MGSVQVSESTTPADVSSALSDLQAARAYCTGLPAQSLPTLSGNLAPGVYALTGNATLSAAASLTLTGSAASVFVITVTGNLTMTAGAAVQLSAAVSPANVYWNVGGKLVASGPARLPGVLMTGDSIRITGSWSAPGVLLSAGNIAVYHASGGATEAMSCYARTGLPSTASCEPGVEPLAPGCVSLVYNGDFEVGNRMATTVLPLGPSNVCNRLTGLSATSPLATTNDVDGWSSASYGTPEWFKQNPTTLPSPRAQVNVPLNFMNTLAGTTPPGPRGGLASNTAYAGLYTTSDRVSPATPEAHREYLLQELAAPLPPQHYYIEYYTKLAWNAPYIPGQLGFAAFATDPYQSDDDRLRDPSTGGPAAAAVWRHDNSFADVTGQQWARTAGIFHASGQERYVVLGDFDDPATATYTRNTAAPHPADPNRRDSYLYLDDFSIHAFPQPVAECYDLNVVCPLPASAETLYQWTIHYADGSVVQSGFSPNPAYTVPHPPTPVTWALTIRLPYPDHSGFFPDVTYPTQPFVLSTPGFFVDAADLEIRGNVVWASDRRVRGTLRIHPDATLTITRGAVIQFDDTRRLAPDLANRTRVVVAAGIVRADGSLEADGGTLIVEQNAVLTVLTDRDICDPEPEARMWDGIVIGGLSNRAQPKIGTLGANGQATVLLQSGARVEHARYGARAGGVTYNAPVAAPGGYPGLVVLQVGGGGGGILVGEDATFRDCYKSTSFAFYTNPAGRPNRSGFYRCTFEGTQELRDPDFYPDYNSTPPVRIGMQYGADLLAVRGINFIGNTFRGYRLPAAYFRYRGIGIGAQDATFVVECESFNDQTRTCDGLPNHFSQLFMGISSSNSYTGGEAVVRGNFFTDNARGAFLGGAHTSTVQYNTFECGTEGVSFCYGLELNNTYDVQPAGNSFVHTPGLSPGRPLRGMNIVDCSKSPSSDNFPLQVYSNTFGDLNNSSLITTALYFRNNNTNVTFRCNKFDGPFGTADVELRGAGGIKRMQGDCFSGAFFTTANNLFSPTCNPVPWGARAREGQLAMEDWPARYTWFRYYYPNPLPDQRMQPSCVTPYNPNYILNGQAIPVGVDVQGCQISGANPESCPDIVLLARDKGDIKAELVTEQDYEKRQALLSELLHQYLTDTTGTSLDSAVVLLERADDPAYSQKRWQLEARLAEKEAAAGNAARAVQRRKPALAQAVTAGAVTQRSAGPTDYGQRVVKLLTPYGSDSLRMVALSADATLRGAFVAMAEDSVTWGCMAARTALNAYAGMHYPIITYDDGENPEAMRPNGAPLIDGQSITVATLLLAPNPSTGHVRVGYGLPQRASRVELRVFDQWGQPQGTYQLNDEALTTGVTLRLREGIYQCQLVADGRVVARERLLITTER